MKILAVINQKGGVAKSTTALAVGSLMAREGKRVLYVDMDAQGNMTYTLGAEGSVPGVLEVLAGSVDPAQALKELAGGSALIGATPNLAGADMVLTQTGKEYRLKEAVQKVAQRFDACVIDTPPALGILTVNALTAADGVVIPAQADMFSLQGIKQLEGTVETVRKYCNPSLKVYGVLLTRFSKRAIISRDVAELLDGMAGGMGSRLFKARIRECTAVKEAQASRVDLIEYAPGCNAVQDYAAFYEELKEVMA